MATGVNPGDEIATTVSACGRGSMTYPSSVQVCDGQLADTVTDGGGVTALAMYPRQPFDFADRTGTITFDVSNDSQGNHGAWPELWVTDQPLPVPFVHESTFRSEPRNGFGIRFAGCTDSSGRPGGCNFPSQVGVDSAVVVDSYAVDDSFNGGHLDVIGDQAVSESRPGQMNHYAVRVSQNQINVYGTDPFSGTWNPASNPLRHLARISNFTLGFTRGLVWLVDAHYNGNKFGNQGTHTFRWDNLGFDGPVLPRDLGFDAPDNDYHNANVGGSGAAGINAAYTVERNGSFNLTVPAVSGVADATGALLTLNFFSESVIPLRVAVNRHDVSVAWPYPDRTTYTTRTIAIPVPLTDIVTGDNTVTFSAGNYLFQVTNVDLILQGAGGIVNP